MTSAAIIAFCQVADAMSCPQNMVKKSLRSATLSAASWERALATSRAVAQVRTSVDCARSSMDMSRISSFFSSAPVARV